MDAFNLDTLPATRNSDLIDILNDRPKKLSLQEFERLPATSAELHIRSQIYKLEAAMFSTVDMLHGDLLDQVMTPIHHFYPGYYVRELTIPPGQVVVGKRHAIQHQVLLTKGSCLCVTERGVETLHAPAYFISPAGEKRVVLTLLESATWITIHQTTHVDLRQIEDQIIIAEPARMAGYLLLREQAMLTNNKY